MDSNEKPWTIIIGYAIIDTQWNIIYKNEVFAEHFAIDFTNRDSSNIFQLKLGFKENTFFPALYNTMTHRVSSEVVSAVSYSHTSCWLEIRAVPVPEGIFIQSLDITTRKKNEQAYIESEDKFRKAFLVNPNGLVVSKADTGIIIDVNDSFLKLFGWTRQEIIGISSIELNMYKNPDDRKMLSQIIFSEGRIRELEIDVKTKTSEIRTVLLSAEILDTPEGKSFLTIIQDITSVRESEKKINALLLFAEQKAAELDAVINSIPDSIFIGTHNGIIKCNKAALNMIGLSSIEELQIRIGEIGKKLNIRSAVTGKRFKEHEMPFMRALNGETVVEEVIATHASTGKDIHIRVASAPVFFNNKVIAAVTVDTDITELKKADKIIRASLKQKDVLLQETYHRTKNHMQVISSLLGIKASAANDPAVTKIIDEVKQQIHVMALVHQKLYQSDDLTTIELDSYIHDISEKLKTTFSHKAKSIIINYRMDKIKVEVDTAISCGLLLSEIITNSFKYAFEPGEAGTISINALEEEGFITFEISDNGRGITDDEILSGNLGIQLVRMIAEDKLEADVKFLYEKGVFWKFRFKNSLT